MLLQKRWTIFRPCSMPHWRKTIAGALISSKKDLFPSDIEKLKAILTVHKVKNNL
jgi:hypothetical protein